MLALSALAACSPVGSKGTIPPPGPDGELDPSLVPDFVAFAGRTDRIIGWVPKACLFPEEVVNPAGPVIEPCPVYADDLLTLIGHSVPGKGFVPLGVDPAVVPDVPVQQGPSFAPPDG